MSITKPLLPCFLLPPCYIPDRALTRDSLEPLGVLVFSIVMVTSFCQVALEAIQRLMSPEHEIIELYVSPAAPLFSYLVLTIRTL